MTDIVERLRAGFQCAEIGNRCRTMDAQSGCACAEAADEIERLRNVLGNIQQSRVLQGKSIIEAADEITRLRAREAELVEALREIESNWETPMEERGWRAVAAFMWKTARAALAKQEKSE